MSVWSRAFLVLFPASLIGAPVDLVNLGQETFQSLGCAECHSGTKNDKAVKTGPNLFGLFPSETRKREILEPGENHRHQIEANFDYFQKSLRDPASEISIIESGPTKGAAFQPVMPPYPEGLLSKQKAQAIFHYLQTLNDKGKQGPDKVMAELEEGTQIKDIHQDPHEILVTDRTRIYRARMAGNSARAVYVGLPSGLNYSFDPRTMSITKAWWGGFINIAGETNGRGRGMTKMGHEAREVTLVGMPEVNDEPQNLSFKTPLIGDEETIAYNLHGEADFADQLAANKTEFLGYTFASKKDGVPSFHYSIDGVKHSLTFNIAKSGEASLVVTKDGKGKQMVFKTEPPESVWRPNDIPSLGTQKVALTPMKQVIEQPGYSSFRVPAPVDPHGRPQLFEPVGMAKDSDGSIVVTTRTAGAWRFHNNTWTMIAEGFLDSLGVVIEKDRLIVGQKPEITELRDLNGDGFYESYRTLSDDFLITENYHEYLHGPAKGEDGCYYFALNLGHRDGRPIYKANGNFMGSQGGYRGWVLRVSPEGETTRFAYGLRSPAGVATGPDGVLYYTENQGEYNGTSKLHRLVEFAYYGHPSSLVDLAGMKPNSPEIIWDKWAAKSQPALALMPHSRIANSPGSPSWDTTGGKFGPFAGQMFVGDQTLSNLFRILPKPENEAAVIHFAEGFPSGVMRLCFDNEGALFVGQTGRGWRARGGKEHALVKMVYNKNPKPLLKDITKNGNAFTLHFTAPVAKESGDQPLEIESWRYLDRPAYGSPEDNKQKEEAASLQLSNDRMKLTVVLKENSERSVEGSRVFRFRSKTLPRTRNAAMEAYYTISR